MSAVAEPSTGRASDDRLARRNALVLAVTQALAGGNNTVLVATAAIVGIMLAPDKALATLPISIFVLGHVGGHAAARRAGAAPGPAQRAADRHCLRRARRPDLLPGGVAGLVRYCSTSAPSSAAFTRQAISPTVSPPPIPRARRSGRRRSRGCCSAASSAAVVGAQLVIGTQDLWQPYLFAATYIGQAVLALISAGVLMLLNIPKPPPRSVAGDGRAAVRDRQAAALHRGGRLRGRSLLDDEHGHDLGTPCHGHVQSLRHRCDARPAMARAGHVRAELHHRHAHCPLWARTHYRSGARPHRRGRDRSASPGFRCGISGSGLRCSASDGISPSSARPPW